jgi:hypothetical protein
LPSASSITVDCVPVVRRAGKFTLDAKGGAVSHGYAVR